MSLSTKSCFLYMHYKCGIWSNQIMWNLWYCLSRINGPCFLWYHDDAIKWKHFPRNWPFVRGIHRSPVNSPHKGQWRGALMFSFFFYLNKRLGKQSWGWWFETLSRSLWRHCNDKDVKAWYEMKMYVSVSYEFSARKGLFCILHRQHTHTNPDTGLLKWWLHFSSVYAKSVAILCYVIRIHYPNILNPCDSVGIIYFPLWT